MCYSRFFPYKASRILCIFVLLFIIACKKSKEKESDLPALGTCQPVEPRADLVSLGDGIYKYNSRGSVVIKLHRASASEILTITLTDTSYPNIITYQLWGKTEESGTYAALHESLNGKHIKNRIGANRTIYFPDGTKITCVSGGPEASVSAISIYDGPIAHHINITCDKVEFSASYADLAKRLDELQPDGETSTFELTPGGLLFYTIYTEDTPGDKVEQRLNLGELFDNAPTQVNDLYDDPRLWHT